MLIHFFKYHTMKSCRHENEAYQKHMFCPKLLTKANKKISSSEKEECFLFLERKFNLWLQFVYKLKVNEQAKNWKYKWKLHKKPSLNSTVDCGKTWNDHPWRKTACFESERRVWSLSIFLFSSFCSMVADLIFYYTIYDHNQSASTSHHRNEVFDFNWVSQLS